jgi:hypothetical protein
MLCSLRLHQTTRVARPSRIHAVRPMASVDVYVKAVVGNPSKLGDCPFCHRVLLTLETKKVGRHRAVAHWHRYASLIVPDWRASRRAQSMPLPPPPPATGAVHSPVR